jgi:hypothetical protein
MPLKARVVTYIEAQHDSVLDLETVRSDYSKRNVNEFAAGTGNGQVDRKFTDKRTLAASANEDLDLAGSLVDAFGAVITFAKVRAIRIKAAPENTNNVVVKPAAANGFLGPFGAAAHTLTLPPGGEVVLVAPVAGWPVTAGTADLLNVANSGAGTSVTYEVEILGASA